MQAMEILSQAGRNDLRFPIIAELLAATRIRLNGDFAEPSHESEQRRWVASALYNWAEKLSSIHPEEAIYWAERARRLEWTNWQIDALCGRAYLNAGAHEQAFLHLSKAVAECGSAHEPIMLYALSALQAGEASAALRTLERMTLGEPGRRRAAAWAAMAAINLAHKEHGPAVAALRKAIESDRDWPLPYAMLRDAWTDMGWHAQAEVARVRFEAVAKENSLSVWPEFRKLAVSPPRG